ncbi:primosomal protein N' [Thermoactinomyces sp. DSM 45892]|uniref:primosomal protein N' n=1 Tax=Thermoactinomyces sp. DSM 45892 TaxID=1882753 RepID=UPI000896D6B9|nr:primosomal protein N' [Thermoactinomyces sp. DSM 45892]SDY57838.1 replication restart DNA helicase PriA [Thermoactinomyces sp. DSM 45892]
MPRRSGWMADVYVEVPAKAVDRPYSYLIPDEWRDDVQIGSRVQVPFGPRRLIGYVVDVREGELPSRVKAIQEVLDLQPPLTPELVRIGRRMADEYLCTTITALQAMVPSVLKGTYQKRITLATDYDQRKVPASLEEMFVSLHQAISQGNGVVSWEEACQIQGIHRAILKRLSEQGLIRIYEVVGDKITKQTTTWVWLTSSADREMMLRDLPKRAMKQREVCSYLLEKGEEVSLPELLSATATARTTVKSLVEKGIVSWEEREEYRDPYAHRTFEQTTALSFTDEQADAFEAIMKPIKNGQAETILLHGVTGSGKTEIYLQAIAEVLAKGKEAIVLVPEISLTPQMVDRFKGRFGSQVAVLHSRLSSGERFDEWLKIRRGEVKIVVGARSAIFAPFERLGIIIIDEEHESSYKQEENPRYHAREIAQWRILEHQTALVLGSATPQVESYFAARTGEYRLVNLHKRVHGRPLPKVEVVDLREELAQGNRSMFSRSLKTELIECIQRGEQAVLFLNRRGYSTFVMCRDCGETLACPHCEISLTYHETNRTVRCHYCGYASQLPKRCPQCESEHIRHFGTGTQKVEAELSKAFPGIRVIRMDVDTTSRKGSHERLLNDFGAGRADVLLGTQMIAKGLDFPKVTLVGVIAADSMLHLPDFRAAERTYQLLTQVSGRAGRHEYLGKVIIQTYSTDHYSIQAAAEHWIEDFYRQECQMRKLHLYPPFRRLYTMVISHPDRLRVLQYGQELVRSLNQGTFQYDYQVLGPVPAMIPKIKDRYRLQIMIKYEANPELSTYVKERVRQATQLQDDSDLRIQIQRDGV